MIDKKIVSSIVNLTVLSTLMRWTMRTFVRMGMAALAGVSSVSLALLIAIAANTIIWGPTYLIFGLSLPTMHHPELFLKGLAALYASFAALVLLIDVIGTISCGSEWTDDGIRYWRKCAVKYGLPLPFLAVWYWVREIRTS